MTLSVVPGSIRGPATGLRLPELWIVALWKIAQWVVAPFSVWIVEFLTMKPVMSLSFILSLALLLLGFGGCRSPYFADKGAALGGVAGGLAGAAMGDHSGQAAGGAIVGATVGALTGAAIGDSMDAEVDRRQAAVAYQQRMASAVSVTDVTAMSLSGLTDDVIVNHIRANGVRASLTPREIIELHEHGVSENVINVMQQEVVRQSSTPMVVGSPPVIIEESYVVPAYWGPRRPRCYHPVPRHRRPGVSWGVSYSH